MLVVAAAAVAATSKCYCCVEYGHEDGGDAVSIGITLSCHLKNALLVDSVFSRALITAPLNRKLLMASKAVRASAAVAKVINLNSCEGYV